MSEVKIMLGNEAIASQFKEQRCAAIFDAKST